MAPTTIGDTTTYSCVIFDGSPTSDLPDDSCTYAWYFRYGSYKVVPMRILEPTIAGGGFATTSDYFKWDIQIIFNDVVVKNADRDTLLKALMWWSKNDAATPGGLRYLYMKDGTGNVIKFGTYSAPTTLAQLTGRETIMNIEGRAGQQHETWTVQFRRYTG